MALLWKRLAIGFNFQTNARQLQHARHLGSIVRIRTASGANMISVDVFNDPNQTPPQRGDTVSLDFTHDNLLILK